MDLAEQVSGLKGIVPPRHLHVGSRLAVFLEAVLDNTKGKSFTNHNFTIGPVRVKKLEKLLQQTSVQIVSILTLFQLPSATDAVQDP